VPATVLDCFVGSGTTLIAADRLGRSAIGIDVQPTYIDLAAGRARRDAPLFATVEVERQAEAAAKQRDLFSVLDEMQGTQEAAGE
jgi:2-polyprenyl-3-methyl-5-hydroxy-6-metoxy-1,4-benzoquinol methylase